MGKIFIGISTAAIILVIIFTCTASRTRFVHISEARCWGDLSIGDHVEGTANLHLFKDGRSFLKNSKCKTEVLFVNENGSTKLLDSLNWQIDNYPNAIGVHVRVDANGRIYKNDYLKDWFISAKLIQIEKTTPSNMVVIDLNHLDR